MFFDEFNDEEWFCFLVLIVDEFIWLNCCGCLCVELCVVVNVVLWILMIGEVWFKLFGCYLFGLMCCCCYEEWFVNGMLLQMIDVLIQFSGCMFVYILLLLEVVVLVCCVELVFDNDCLCGVFW